MQPRPIDTTSGIPEQWERNMTNLAKTAGLAGVIAVALATATPALTATKHDHAVREGQAAATALDANASAITYWVKQSDGWHVVTTVDSVIERNDDGEKHAVVRFSSVLMPGQSQLISVPSAISEQQQVLRIRRLGDQIEIARIPGSSV
ncbi:MAG TPA: hypothetical protein VFE41_07535 [Acetobacteraceae bacterium]|nr:hypothetical protein [Acetobacteraceae bacterium]